jgi:glutathione S-transferase
MADDRLTLHAETLWCSPYVFSSWVALHELGLPFDVVEVSLLDLQNREPAYRDRSLTAKVPSLVHGGFWIAESSAIAEYLEDVFPERPRLFPRDPKARARARQLMAWMRSDLGALRDERPTVTMFFERAITPLSPRGEEAAAMLLRVAGQVLAPGATSLFGPWCLADSELAFMLHRLLLNEHDVPAGIRAFAETQWARPSVQSFVCHPRPATLPVAYWSLPWNLAPGAPTGGGVSRRTPGWK